MKNGENLHGIRGVIAQQHNMLNFITVVVGKLYIEKNSLHLVELKIVFNNDKVSSLFDNNCNLVKGE